MHLQLDAELCILCGHIVTESCCTVHDSTSSVKDRKAPSRARPTLTPQRFYYCCHPTACVDQHLSAKDIHPLHLLHVTGMNGAVFQQGNVNRRRNLKAADARLKDLVRTAGEDGSRMHNQFFGVEDVWFYGEPSMQCSMIVHFE